MAGRRPTPTEQVHAPDFPIVLRGYDRAAVDAYVSRVIEVVDELQARQTPDGVVKRALEQVGEETSEILKRAHETADEITSRSRVEAEERLERARVEAEEIVGTARRSLESLDKDTDRVWVERTKLLEDTKRLADDLLAVAEGGLERFPPEETAETRLMDGEAVAERDLAPDIPVTEPIEPPIGD